MNLLSISEILRPVNDRPQSDRAGGLRRFAWLSGAALLLGSAQLHAASSTWSAATGGNYFDVTKWASGAAAYDYTATATFNRAEGGAIFTDGSPALANILFESTAGAYTFNSSGHFFEIESGGSISAVGTGSASQWINAPVATRGHITFSNNKESPEHTLNFGGAVYSRQHGGKTLTLAGSNTGANTISGNISDGIGIVGAFAITKNGSGTWVLGGANTNTGVTTINDGLLLVTGTHTGGGAYTINGGALGGAGGRISANGITLGAGGGLDVSGSGALAAGTLTLAMGAQSFNISLAGEESLRFALETPGTSDHVHLTSGTLNIGEGVLNLSAFQFNFGPAAEGVYTLFTTSSENGIVGTLASTGLIASLGDYNVELRMGSTGDGFATLNLEVIAVPEPSTGVFIGVALLAGGAILLRRK